MESQSDVTPRMVVCLIAGRDAVERFPTLLKYLQLGLVDESIPTLRVVTQGEPLTTLQTGTMLLLQDRPLAWPLGRWSRRSFIADIARKLEAMNGNAPTIVHGLAPGTMDIASDVAIESGSELVFTVSSMKQIEDAASMRLLSRASALAPISPLLAEVLPPSVRSAKVVEIIPIGVHPMNQIAAFKNAQRAPVIVYAGPLSDNEELETLLRALKQVVSRHPNVLLFLLGKGPAEDHLRRMVESLEISDHVTFTGRLDDWRNVLDAADIFCIPRAQTVWREEPLAALAAGVCVVAAEGSLCDELVHERTALLFPQGSDAALAHCFLKLLGDTEFARMLAAAGQGHVRISNPPAQLVSKHIELYRRLARPHQTLAFSGDAVAGPK
ncbi:MAG: glycosyltransferase family 4 protein [Planctomycetota bacterium]